MSDVPSAYYHRVAHNEFTVICPFCKKLHTYYVSGEVRCYKTEEEFRIVAPFTPSQHFEAAEVVSRLVAGEL